MLSVVHIENVAVIKRADIEFKPGFNVLTGETGAGKSILIDAISAMLGERTSRDIIRTGAQSSQVSAVFTKLSPSILEWLSDNGLSADDEILVQREIFPDGRNICRVNGRPLNVSLLRELGSQLINIHGQHDSQKLLNEEFHITYVDNFGKTDPVLSEYTASYKKLSEIKHKIDALSIDENEKNRKIENLSYQIDELERAGLKTGEDDELTARLKILQNSDKVKRAMDDSYSAIYGGEDTPGILEIITGACRSLSGISGLSGKLDSLLEQLNELQYLAGDVTENLRELRSDFDYSPEEIEIIQARLDIIHKLKRKYGNNVSEMLLYLDKCKTELEQIEVSGDALVKLNEKYQTQIKKCEILAEKLTETRKNAAELLKSRIISELRELDMQRAAFEIEFSEKPLSFDGGDVIRFLISMNAGETLKPMSKVASGGELARIMLALKNVLAESDDIDTLIFDEVDAGVSGRAAQKVAQKLKDVSFKKQVLCITHLPQIASAANIHFKIEKDEDEGRTFTYVSELSFEGRKEELARIIGGAEITETTLNSAAELLAQNGVTK